MTLFLFFHELYSNRNIVDSPFYIFIQKRQCPETDGIFLGGYDYLVVLVHIQCLHFIGYLPDVFLIEEVVIGEEDRIEVVGFQLQFFHQRLRGGNSGNQKYMFLRKSSGSSVSCCNWGKTGIKFP